MEMAVYLLECPDCEARFELKRHKPDRRVRCRKCRAVMIVPRAPGDPALAAETWKPLDPARRRRMVRAFSLPRLAMISGAACLVLSGTVWLFVVQGRGGVASAPSSPPPRKLTVDDVRKDLNRFLALPLASGFSWEYSLSNGGRERRRVTRASEGAGGGPEFTQGVTGSSKEGARRLRALPDGVYLVAESRGPKRWTLKPAVLLVPHPIYVDDAWKYNGKAVREGGAIEPWSLTFTVRGAERMNVLGEPRPAFRVEVRGMRGGEAAHETLWYVKGIGLVKRRTNIAGGIEEAMLVSRRAKSESRNPK